MWNDALMNSALQTLQKYQNTQLPHHAEELTAIRSSFNMERQKAVVAKRRVYLLGGGNSMPEGNGTIPEIGEGILPRLGLEEGVLALISPGFELSKTKKRSLDRLIAEAGFEWAPQKALHCLERMRSGTGLTVVQMSALRQLKDACFVHADDADRVMGVLDALEVAADAAADDAFYVSEELTDRPNCFFVAFPYAHVEEFKREFRAWPKNFDRAHVYGRFTQKGWLVEVPSGVEAKKLSDFADRHYLPLIAGARSRLAALATAAALPPPPPVFLAMDGDRLIIPVPVYSAKFTEWVKATGQGRLIFSKTLPKGPRWEVPSALVGAFAPLLDATHLVYAQTGIPAYKATVEARIKVVRAAGASPGPAPILPRGGGAKSTADDDDALPALPAAALRSVKA
jgi:hypothetical protein